MPGKKSSTRRTSLTSPMQKLGTRKSSTKGREYIMEMSSDPVFFIAFFLPVVISLIMTFYFSGKLNWSTTNDSDATTTEIGSYVPSWGTKYAVYAIVGTLAVVEMLAAYMIYRDHPNDNFKTLTMVAFAGIIILLPAMFYTTQQESWEEMFYLAVIIFSLTFVPVFFGWGLENKHRWAALVALGCSSYILAVFWKLRDNANA